MRAALLTLASREWEPNLNLEEQRLKGEAAQHLANNPILKEAFQSIRTRLEERRMSAKPTELELCADAIRVEQLLKAVEREINNFIATGKMADIELGKKKFITRFQR